MRIRLVLLIAFLSVALPVRAQVPPALLGEWRLSVEKSVYVPGPAPYRRGTMVVEMLGDQVRFSYDLVRPRGGTQHMEWTGRFDGSDYMVQGVDDYVTYAYTMVDANTYEVVTKLEGETAAVSRVTISPDGRTVTTTTGGKNPRGEEITNTTVYEKVR
jgi:hypothetical protein